MTQPSTQFHSPHKPSMGERKALLRLADEMDALAVECTLPWLNNAQDPLGGAYGFLDREFRAQRDEDSRPRGPSLEVRGDKSLVQQARHLYSYSIICERRGRTPALAQFADSLFALLETSFWQGDGQAMVHQITADHRVRRKDSQIYAQSFAIFGLATYSHAFSNERAAEMALSLFHTLDVAFHDQKYGGYDQEDDGDWLQDVGAPEGARKCTNTHIHILEALTPLYGLFPNNKPLRSRLTEMVKVICNHLVQGSGYVHKHFLLDWTPVGPPECSYGHDLETSWLILEAAASLDHETQELARRQARAMAEHALRTGWDDAGGLFDFGSPELGISQTDKSSRPLVQGREKVWWAQAESLAGIYRLYQETGQPELLQKLHLTFAFLRDKSRDSEFGEFYWGVDSEGSLGPRGDHKGEIWKTPYHALRALLLTADWIRSSVRKDPSID